MSISLESLEPTQSLLERLRSLKPLTSQVEESCSQKETPLWVFLYIYLLSKKEGYINHMEGAKALIKMLKPISFPSRELVSPLPELFRSSYEVSELARHLCTSPQYLHLEEWRYIEDAIYYSLTKEMPEGFHKNYRR